MSLRSKRPPSDVLTLLRSPILVGVSLLAAQCKLELGDAACVRCVDECPGSLECSDGFCVEPGMSMSCGDGGSGGDLGSGGTEGGAGGSSAGTGSGGTNSSGTNSAGSAGTAGGVSGSSNTGGSSGECSETPRTCEATILSPTEIDVECGSAGFSIQLEATCACDGPDVPRNVKWTLRDPVDLVELSATGELSGAPLPGRYEFDVNAKIDNEYSVGAHFTLTVENRCLVMFSADDSETGSASLRAAERATGDAVDVPAPAPAADEEASEPTLVHFSIAPDGRFLARITDDGTGERLDLLALGANEIEPLELGYDGTYLNHAFSPDSLWLALVTTNSDPEGPPTLLLFALDGTPQEVDSMNIPYVKRGGDEPGEDLIWVDNKRLAFMGKASESILYSAFEQSVEDAEPNGYRLSGYREASKSRRGPQDPFYGLRAGNGGFAALYGARLVFVDEQRQEGWEHTYVEALSPNLEWVVRDDDLEGVQIDPTAALVVEGNPFGTATQCEIVRAWSLDGTRLLCTDSGEWMVYETSPESGPLDHAALNLEDGLEPEVRRMAFSGKGNWLALVPNADGVVLASASALATGDLPEASLVLPKGTNEWDFAFTKREDQLVVQYGRELVVFPLDEQAGPGDPWKVEGVTLPSVPDCLTDSTSEVDRWCGAPHFTSNWVFSHGERHLAFADDQTRTLRVVDLAEKKTIEIGTVSRQCLWHPALKSEDTAHEPPCVQFQ